MRHAYNLRSASRIRYAHGYNGPTELGPGSESNRLAMQHRDRHTHEHTGSTVDIARDEARREHRRTGDGHPHIYDRNGSEVTRADWED